MELVIDANILIAALIKESFTRFILFNDSIKLYAPEFIFDEIEKYSDFICKKSGKSKVEFKIVLEVLSKRMYIIPKKDFTEFISKANKYSPDPKDVPYLALAIKLKIPIWSNDKALKEKQNIVIVYTTSEVNSKLI